KTSTGLPRHPFGIIRGGGAMRKPLSRPEQDEHGTTQTSIRHHPRRRSHEEASVKTDRKSTRLNSSHVEISYAVFCLKKKKKEGNNDKFREKNIKLPNYHYEDNIGLKKTCITTLAIFVKKHGEV